MVAFTFEPFFNSKSTTGSPLMKQMTSGRLVFLGPLTVNWFTATKSLALGSSQSISLARPWVQPWAGSSYSTGTPWVRYS